MIRDKISNILPNHFHFKKNLTGKTQVIRRLAVLFLPEYPIRLHYQTQGRTGH